jgi:hypothetical protein
MKICIKCNVNPKRSTGSYCKSCHNEYQKAAYKKNPYSTRKYGKKRSLEIRELVQNAKNKPCQDCGKEYPYYVMDLDHVRGDKRFNLSIAASKMRSLKSVQEEIDKCDVVCSNCHRERTFNRLNCPVV